MLISLGLFFILFFYCRSTFLKRLFFAFFIASFHFTLSTFISSNFTRVVLFLERVSENGTVVRTILSLVLAIIFYAIFRFGSNYWLEKPIKIDKKYVALSLLLILLTFLGFLASNSAYWTKSYFGNVGIDEIFYTLSQPLTGTDQGQIYAYLLGPLLNSIVITQIIIILLYFMIMIRSSKTTRIVKFSKKSCFLSIFFTVILLLANIVLGLNKLGFNELKAYFFEKSTIYEDFYVDPNSISITFPEDKRNLIYIFVESLETTYLSSAVGGAQQENLMPNITELSYSDGLNFSNQKLLGGAIQVPGVGFTVGGMVGQSTGVPLRVTGGYSENDYGNTEHFMPGITSIGDILHDNGYNQILLLGSDADFGGRKKFYEQHGDYEIRDYNYANDHGWIPKDRKVWWGYEDEKLFEFAKNTLLEQASLDQPFNLTMLTADTHFPDGYKNENTPEIFDEQLSNVIYYSDQMIGDFIAWIKAQPFYENTTIVIAGDHLNMDQGYFASIEETYQRTVFNLFINSPITTLNNTERQFSTLDLFPTTLAALGVQIEGDRIGLGTNLYSDNNTLMEFLGYETFTSELSKNSSFYNKYIMKGSDLTINTNSNN